MDNNFNFDLERMKIAVESPTIQLPKGLSREDLRKYLKERVEELEKKEVNNEAT